MNLFFFRHNISLNVIRGECKSFTDEITSSWNETTLSNILSNYKLENIFNYDNFGFFYQCFPNKIYYKIYFKIYKIYSNTASVNSIRNSTWMKEKLLLSLKTLQRIRQFPTWQTFTFFSYPQTLRQFFKQWTKVLLEALKGFTRYKNEWKEHIFQWSKDQQK